MTALYSEDVIGAFILHDFWCQVAIAFLLCALDDSATPSRTLAWIFAENS